MKLHEDADVFAELIGNAAQTIGLPQVYVEKDYWVTQALRHLSLSPYAESAVFKGGTSLSKAYKLIHRFSEDIDLAILADGLNGGQRKKLLKQIETATAQGLIHIEDGRQSKGSSFRKTVYRYPRQIAETEFGQASSELLIEVNAFTRPEPFEARPIQTLIADTLQDLGRTDLIEQYALESFPVRVLSIKRTLVEKLLGVIKDSYDENPVARLSIRIRHLYDICQILKLKEYQDFLHSEDFHSMCTACIEDERTGAFENAGHLDNPLGQAPIFSEFSAWTPSLQTIYQGTFSQFVYGDLPPMSDVGDTIILIGNRLR